MSLESPIKGNWWLPGSHRASRPGVLRKLPNDFEVELERAWRDDIMVNLFQREERLTLWGKDRNGKPISAIGAGLMSFSLFSERSPARFSFDTVVRGAHCE